MMMVGKQIEILIVKERQGIIIHMPDGNSVLAFTTLKRLYDDLAVAMKNMKTDAEIMAEPKGPPQ